MNSFDKKIIGPNSKMIAVNRRFFFRFYENCLVLYQDILFRIVIKIEKATKMRDLYILVGLMKNSGRDAT